MVFKTYSTMLYKLLSYLALLALSVNCSTFSATREVKRMNIANPGITIEAHDKSFIIKSGEEFNTPFFSVKERGSTCDLPTTFLGWIFWSIFTGGLGPLWAVGCAANDQIPYDDMMVSYNFPGRGYYETYDAKWAVKNGGKKVKITSPQGKFEGVLMIFPILIDSASGPITRSYEINLPPSTFIDASGGKIAVVYEPYPKSDFYKGWILWMSDRPFVE